jgi:hypothetical protein
MGGSMTGKEKVIAVMAGLVIFAGALLSQAGTAQARGDVGCEDFPVCATSCETLGYDDDASGRDACKEVAEWYLNCQSDPLDWSVGDCYATQGTTCEFYDDEGSTGNWFYRDCEYYQESSPS